MQGEDTDSAYRRLFGRKRPADDGTALDWKDLPPALQLTIDEVRALNQGYSTKTQAKHTRPYRDPDAYCQAAVFSKGEKRAQPCGFELWRIRGELGWDYRPARCYRHETDEQKKHRLSRSERLAAQREAARQARAAKAAATRRYPISDGQAEAYMRQVLVGLVEQLQETQMRELARLDAEIRRLMLLRDSIPA